MAQSLCVLTLLGAVFVCAQFSLVSSGCPGGMAALASAAASTNGGVATTLRTDPHQCHEDDCCDIECPYGLLGLSSILTGIPNHLVCGLVCGCSCPDGEPGAQASCSNTCGFNVCGALCGQCKCKSKCCPEGWSKFNNYCYKYFTPAAPNQDAAEASCVANGGHLASIHSAAENTFVNDLVIPDTHFFTGLEVGHAGADWKFTCSRYTDGTPVDYGADPAAQGIPPWCVGSPKNHLGTSNCVKSHSELGENNCWNDWHCTDPMTYVCKKPAACA